MISETDGSNGSDLRSTVELRKYPHPYSAAVTVASDIDNATCNRFSAVHALFCGSDVIRPGTVDWETLGLTEDSRWHNAAAGGVPGLGLDLADSFFLIADDVSMGMYRFDPLTRAFGEDWSDGRNACDAIKRWLRQGQIDTFHGFLHYTRSQVLPLLEEFYRWCDREGVAKPCAWINHSVPVCPSGICHDSFRPNKYYALAREIARYVIGPLTGRKRRPIYWRQPWYHGARPGSPYYINDILKANGLKYVWLEAGQDEIPNRIDLPEYRHGGRSSILEPVTMDDGVRYYRFRRCYGKVDAPAGVTVALRTSDIAFDASRLFSEANLEHLFSVHGTCILFTHWTLARNLPIQDETIGNFERVRAWRDRGKIWVAPLSKLLEWTRLRAFLKYSAVRGPDRLAIDIGSVEDPVFGRQNPAPQDLQGLAFDVPPEAGPIEVRLAGKALPAGNVHRSGAVCWLDDRQ